MDSYLLRELFCRLHESKAEYEVKLYSNEIVCQPVKNPNNKQYNISLSSVIGCRCMKANEDTDPRSYLTIYAYPKSSSGVRRRQTYTFFYDKHAEYEENLAITRKWKLAICYLVSASKADIGIIKSYLNGELDSPPEIHRRWLIFLNPFSGKKLTLKVFDTFVSKMLAEAEVDYTLIVTEYGGHAREFISKANLNDFTGIVTTSGDGLLFEVVNGLLNRPDWKKAIKTPLGVIPTGSGNAFSTMICVLSGERTDRNHVLHASYLLAKPSIRELAIPNPNFDIMAVDSPDGRMYSFLAVTWGIIADIDIESEKFRFMGGARFTVGLLSRILSMRRYRGRLSFLPVDFAEAKEVLNSKHQRAMSFTGIPDGIIADNDSVKEDTLNGANVGRYRSLEDLSGKVNVNESSDISTSSSSPKKIESDNHDGASTSGAHSSTSGSPVLSDSAIETNLLSKSTSDPVPLNWITIEDSFIGVIANRCSHLAYDLTVCPDTRPGDGCIWLSVVRSTVSRQNVLKQFIGMGKPGVDITKVPAYGIELFKVKAFRMEPIPASHPDRIMTVDGERITYGVVQGQILPGMGVLL